MPSFAIPKFTVLLEPLWVSAEFLCLSTGPILDGTDAYAASHGVSTLRLSSPYLQYDSSGTFRNVPLLLSHACLCAGRFDAYIETPNRSKISC